MENINFIIITGLSGAGKTRTIQCMEDLGFFCVDNLPPSLIPKFAELCVQSEGKINRVALVVDIRGRDFFNHVYAALEILREMNIRYRILFLDASDETLVRRFKETRRRHPLAKGGQILEGIQKERYLLQDLKGIANKIIDTSHLSPKQLKEEIMLNFIGKGEDNSLVVSVVSFGYKYGIPIDADLVIDVRFLPNPYYDPQLRPFTGEDPLVRDYVLGNKITVEFMQKFMGLIEFLIPCYIDEGKTHLTIAVGCTGGKHRSVTIARELAGLIQNDGYEVVVEHRDIKKDLAGED